MKIKTNTIVGIIVGFLAVISCLTTVIFRVSVVPLSLASLLLFVILFTLLKGVPRGRGASYIVPALIMLWFLLVNSSWTRFDTVLFIAMIFFCIASEYSISWTKVAFSIAQVGYMFYALTTIFLFFNREIYMNYIVKLYPQTANRLIGWYNKGYMAGITNHYSTNAMLLAAGLMLFGTRAIACGLGNRTANRKEKIQNLCCVILLTVSLLLTAKRAHILFVFASLFFVYFNGISSQKKSNKMLKALGVIIVVLLLANIVFSAFPALSGFITRFQDLLDEGNIAMGRFSLWSYAVDAFKSNWLFGIGWKNYPSLMSIAYNGTKTYDTHNIYLQLLAETGIIGASVFFLWFLVSLSNAVYAYKRISNGDNKNDKSLVAFSLGFQIFFLLYGMTGNPLYDSEMYIMYFASCGIALFYRNALTKRGNTKEENSQKE